MENGKSDVSKLIRHAKNVRIAANDCEEYIEMLHQVISEDKSTEASKQNLIDKEQLKQSCLSEAATFMEYVAEKMGTEGG